MDTEFCLVSCNTFFPHIILNIGGFVNDLRKWGYVIIIRIFVFLNTQYFGGFSPKLPNIDLAYYFNGYIIFHCLAIAYLLLYSHVTDIYFSPHCKQIFILV